MKKSGKNATNAFWTLNQFFGLLFENWMFLVYISSDNCWILIISITAENESDHVESTTNGSQTGQEINHVMSKEMSSVDDISNDIPNNMSSSNDIFKTWLICCPACLKMIVDSTKKH